MPSLPIASDFTGAAVTEAGFKTAITNQREFLAGLLGTSGNQIDALVAMGVLGADTVSKTSAYTVIASDRGKVILCDGTFTLSLTAAATLGDGFTFAVINTGTGTITIDPNSTETIDGAATDTIAAGSWAIVTCTGTAFYTMGSVPATGALIGYQVFTSSGTYTKATNNPSFVIVQVVGGGGGATGGGGTSSFGTFCSATGGAVSTTGGSGAAGGSGSGGDVNTTGTRGTILTCYTSGLSNDGRIQAVGGCSVIIGYGSGSTQYATNAPNSLSRAGGGGGGGYSMEKILASSLASSETVTVGAAGSGTATVAATGGIVIVWEYK